MIYVTGDGFAAASYADSTFSWANQDSNYPLLGQLPHPANTNHSFAETLSQIMHMPYLNVAYQHNSYEKILRDLQQALVNRPNYVVVCWPNCYRSEVEYNNSLIQFEFQQIRNQSLPADLRQAMQAKINQCSAQTTVQYLYEQLDAVCAEMNQLNIKYAFFCSDYKLTIPNALGDQTIVEWAAAKNYLNGAGYLNQFGHKEIAKIIAIHLTKQ